VIGLPGKGGHRSRWMILALVGKVLVIVALVVLPTELAVSLGAAHGVALAVAGSAVAVAVAVRRRRRSAQPPHHGHRRAHAQAHGHGSDPAPNGRPATEIDKDGKGA
jgi:hypothetical protein